MVTTEKRITTAQLFTVIFILGMSLKMLMLPILLLKASGRDAVLSMTLILIVELVCLILVTSAMLLAPQTTFPELLGRCIGKWGAKIVLGLLALLFVFKLVLLSGEVRIFFSENLFTEFPWSVYALPLFAFCALVGMGTARAIGRMSQFLFPLIAVATVIMFLLTGGLDYSRILPLAEYGLSNLFPDAARYAMWYGDYSALLVFFGCVKRSRHTFGLGVTAGVISAATVLFFTLGLTASFADVADYIRFGQNITGMSHFALGNSVQGRFDLTVFSIWLLSIFIKAGIFTYAAVRFICEILGCKATIPSLSVGGLLYVLTLLNASSTSLHTFMMQVCFIPALVFQMAVPIVAFACALATRKKDAKRAKTEGGGEAENAT